MHTKLILYFIAFGLLLNGLNPWITPSSAFAEYSFDPLDLLKIESLLDSIYISISNIELGICNNPDLCKIIDHSVGLD